MAEVEVPAITGSPVGCKGTGQSSSRFAYTNCCGVVHAISIRSSKVAPVRLNTLAIVSLSTFLEIESNKVFVRD